MSVCKCLIRWQIRAFRMSLCCVNMFEDWYFWQGLISWYCASKQIWKYISSTKAIGCVSVLWRHETVWLKWSEDVFGITYIRKRKVSLLVLKIFCVCDSWMYRCMCCFLIVIVKAPAGQRGQEPLRLPRSLTPLHSCHHAVLLQAKRIHTNKPPHWTWWEACATSVSSCIHDPRLFQSIALFFSDFHQTSFVC